MVAVQGAAPEHMAAFSSAMARLGVVGETVLVRRARHLEGVDCLAIPGGESTAISKLIHRFGIHDAIVRAAEEGMPIMGTCAGCVLLAKKGDIGVQRTEIELLRLMDMAVKRNAFGRQRESFEARVKVKGLRQDFPAVFIRGPVITEVWGGCEVCSEYEGKIVMARQDNLMGISFHPELSGDTRLHEMLLQMI